MIKKDRHGLSGQQRCWGDALISSVYVFSRGGVMVHTGGDRCGPEKMKKWGRNKGVAPTLFPILLMSCDKFVTRMCKLLS